MIGAHRLRKVTMAMNRVQFTWPLRWTEFMQRTAAMNFARAALVESRWPQGFLCPNCPAALCTARFGAKVGCTSSARRAELSAASLVARFSNRASSAFSAGSWLLHLLTQSKNNVSALGSCGTWVFATRPPGWSSTSSWRSCAARGRAPAHRARRDGRRLPRR